MEVYQPLVPGAVQAAGWGSAGRLVHPGQTPPDHHVTCHGGGVVVQTHRARSKGNGLCRYRLLLGNFTTEVLSAPRASCKAQAAVHLDVTLH